MTADVQGYDYMDDLRAAIFYERLVNPVVVRTPRERYCFLLLRMFHDGHDVADRIERALGITK